MDLHLIQKAIPISGSSVPPVEPGHLPVQNEKGNIHYENINGKRKRMKGIRANDGQEYGIHNLGDLEAKIGNHNMDADEIAKEKLFGHTDLSDRQKDAAWEVAEPTRKFWDNLAAENEKARHHIEQGHHLQSVREKVIEGYHDHIFQLETSPEFRKELKQAVDLDREIMGGEIEKDTGLSLGGTFETSLIKIKDDGEAIKKSEGYRHEVAASVVDQLLGWDLVPPTTERSEDAASAQRWVDGKTQYEIGDEDLWQKIPEWDKKRLTAFDYLINNYDRHENNLMITPDLRLKAIDNHLGFESGFTFASEETGEPAMIGNQMDFIPFQNHIGDPEQIISSGDAISSKIREHVRGLLENWDEVEHALKGLVPKRNIGYMKLRARMLAREISKTHPDIREASREHKQIMKRREEARAEARNRKLDEDLMEHEEGKLRDYRGGNPYMNG